MHLHEAHDFMLSEIQDHLTIAGFDVPLRSYKIDDPVGDLRSQVETLTAQKAKLEGALRLVLDQAHDAYAPGGNILTMTAGVPTAAIRAARQALETP